MFLLVVMEDIVTFLMVLVLGPLAVEWKQKW